jgi:hypothetical protein
VGIAKGHCEELALCNYTVTYADKLLLDGEAFADAHYHIVDKSAVKAVHGAEAREVTGALELDFISLNGDFDVCVNFLTQLTERAFHLHYVAVKEFSLDTGGKDYR